MALCYWVVCKTKPETVCGDGILLCFYEKRTVLCDSGTFSLAEVTGSLACVFGVSLFYMLLCFCFVLKSWLFKPQHDCCSG